MTCRDTSQYGLLWGILTGDRRASQESILAIQIFDQKKFKKKDQGFLGVINVRIGSVMDLDIGGDGVFALFLIINPDEPLKD